MYVKIFHNLHTCRRAWVCTVHMAWAIAMNGDLESCELSIRRRKGCAFESRDRSAAVTIAKLISNVVIAAFTYFVQNWRFVHEITPSIAPSELGLNNHTNDI